MSTLPSGWANTTLGEITTDCAQKTPADEEQFLYIDIASVDRERKAILSPQQLVGKDAPSRARKLVATGDVLVSMTRPNLNAVALVPSKFNDQIASTGFDVLRPRYVDSRWLFYTVRSTRFIERMSEAVQGALYPAVRGKDIRGFDLPLAPLAEQKRIADKLDSVLARVDACRDRLDRLPALLKRFRQTILAAATSGQLTEDWRAGSESSTAPWAAEFPHGWRWSCPNEIKAAEKHALAIGPFGSDLKVSDYRADGIPLVFVREIRARKFGGVSTKYVTPEKAEKLASHIVSGGDLLITKMGDPPGDTAIYPHGAPMAVITADCIKLKVDERVAISNFVQIILESPQTRVRLQEITAGVAQQKISLQRFRDFPLPLAPLPEQHEIVRRVETLFAFADRLEARLSSARVQVDKLTPALLAKAFRGELVPQDPADEPASELLKRLAAQRETTPKTKHGRKITTPSLSNLLSAPLP